MLFISVQYMVAQLPLNLDQFQKHPLLYRKLCFWAGERGIENPGAQVQEYLTQLVMEAATDRDNYNCLILNCDRLMIVDVDLHAPQPPKIQDCAASCQIAVSQRQAIAALEALTQEFPRLGFRVYRTRNGLRYLCTSQPFDPLESTTHRLMRSLYVDPLYGRLCKF